MSSEAVSYFPKALSGLEESEEARRVLQPLVESNPARNGERDAQATIRTDVSDDSSNHSTDEELMASMREADKQALGLLFQRHGTAVLHVVWRILHNEAEADDVRQDVFLYVYERAHLYDSRKGSASSWIMQVAYHRAIDRRRYLASRQHYDSPVFDEQQSIVGTAPASSDRIDGRAILDRLRHTLTPDQRETLELHLFEGYSLREIAERNDQTLGNVRNHYYRALDRLRAHIFPRKGR
jgi:RNA polymerase sigma-70 factor (ECF subfamily)